MTMGKKMSSAERRPISMGKPVIDEKAMHSL